MRNSSIKHRDMTVHAFSVRPDFIHTPTKTTQKRLRYSDLWAGPKAAHGDSTLAETRLKCVLINK